MGRQPRVIIWTNLVVLEHPMLHTKFQGYQKKVFLRFFIKYGHGGQLGFSFPHPMETPYEIWLQLAHSFLRRCLKSVDDRQMMDGKTTEAYLSYKLTTEPSAGELKKKKKKRHITVL